MRYLIIGNSAAAIGAIDGIRAIDGDGQITVLTDELATAYSRPLISYLVAGKTDEQKMTYRGAEYYAKNDCDVKHGVRATRVVADKKAVETDDGNTYLYDKLLIATGSKPFVPPIAGLDKVSRKQAFLNLNDAKSLMQRLTPQTRLLIVGAGLIGLKCAEGAAGKCASVTVCDMAPRPLSSILDEDGAGIVREHLEGAGIEFKMENPVAEFLDEHTALLKNGERVDFDLVVLASGVKPETSVFPSDAPHGIPTNNYCQTELPDVYAAGDCAQCADSSSGTRRVLALLPNAYMQGECAGKNMAGGDAAYTNAIPMNAIGFFGLHMITAGSMDGDATVFTAPGAYKKLVTKDGLLKGYILIGDVERAGIYTALIRDKKPLSEIDFGLIAQKPQLMAFSRKERTAKLGVGV